MALILDSFKTYGSTLSLRLAPHSKAKVCNRLHHSRIVLSCIHLNKSHHQEHSYNRNLSTAAHNIAVKFLINHSLDFQRHKNTECCKAMVGQTARNCFGGLLLLNFSTAILNFPKSDWKRHFWIAELRSFKMR